MRVLHEMPKKIVLALIVIIFLGLLSYYFIFNNLIGEYLESSNRTAKFRILNESLPSFEDYPAKAYSIPPKPIVNHNSNSYGMRYWTVTEGMVNTSEVWDENEAYILPRTKYDMGGHYLMRRYATGNPDVLIVDGLNGKIYNEFGGFDFALRPDSFLVIFDPFQLEGFSSSGDYQYASGPRYAKWDGSHFVTLCEPIVEKWKVISCENKNGKPE